MSMLKVVLSSLISDPLGSPSVMTPLLTMHLPCPLPCTCLVRPACACTQHAMSCTLASHIDLAFPPQCIQCMPRPLSLHCLIPGVHTKPCTHVAHCIACKLTFPSACLGVALGWPASVDIACCWLACKGMSRQWEYHAVALHTLCVEGAILAQGALGTPMEAPGGPDGSVLEPELPDYGHVELYMEGGSCKLAHLLTGEVHSLAAGQSSSMLAGLGARLASVSLASMC